MLGKTWRRLRTRCTGSATSSGAWRASISRRSIPTSDTIHPKWLQRKPSFGVCRSLPSRSERVWCRRCIATQVMAPPSLASIPMTVKRYSRGLETLKPRWVRSR